MNINYKYIDIEDKEETMGDYYWAIIVHKNVHQLIVFYVFFFLNSDIYHLIEGNYLKILFNSTFKSCTTISLMYAHCTSYRILSEYINYY